MLEFIEGGESAETAEQRRRRQLAVYEAFVKVVEEMKKNERITYGAWLQIVDAIGPVGCSIKYLTEPWASKARPVRDMMSEQVLTPESWEAM